MTGSFMGPLIPDEDPLALPILIVKEFSLPIRESADSSWQGKNALVGIDEIDAPLMRDRIVQTESLSNNVEILLMIVNLELFRVR